METLKAENSEAETENKEMWNVIKGIGRGTRSIDGPGYSYFYRIAPEDTCDPLGLKELVEGAGFGFKEKKDEHGITEYYQLYIEGYGQSEHSSVIEAAKKTMEEAIRKGFLESKIELPGTPVAILRR